MTDSEWYEIRAEAFRQMRGMLAPGNDTEADGHASRTAAWIAWNAVNSGVLWAIRNAIESKNARRIALENLVQVYEPT